MVVAKILKIRNNTLRTFYVQPGDGFYTPSVDGKPCGLGPIEVPPGFDQDTDGLVVPWETLTSCGLEISEAGRPELIRCVVGPVQSDSDNRDWLQYRSDDWAPLEEQKWLMLGQRHLLGTVGSEVTHIDYARKCAASNVVYLNVFDLASALSIPNAILCNTVFNTVGAFHAAIEVYGDEWAFYRTPNPTSCGVCKSLRARQHPIHVYRQSINLGPTSLKDWEVRYLIRGKLAMKWPGGTYDLLRRNCIHFTEELALGLGVQPVPGWVTGLHQTGASVLQIPWPLSAIFNGGGQRALSDAPRQQGEGNADEVNRVETASAAPSVLSQTSVTSGAPPTSGVYDEGRVPANIGSFIDSKDQDQLQHLTRMRS
eukprot:CAMPEP_0115069386 /NCGR_PEP_ID=MMETSP0227-20121206/12528_1 /TAXON_ID=89957 /ORGANISM="Polarella glacialis, Strain CCMP 1383" /LENGTH=368 /DNA_ID=CAMNT_0002455781 /DNA_START=113 /DNA_END=1219 /DNA_ORIENTATION=+